MNHFLFSKAELKCHSCEDVCLFFFLFSLLIPKTVMSTTKWPVQILQTSQDVT